MGSHESLSLLHRFESPHFPLAHPGSLMRLLRSIVVLLIVTVNSVRERFSVRYTVTSQIIGYDLPWLNSMTVQKPLEEALRSGAIPHPLQVQIHDLAVLIYGSPEVVLLAVYLDEDFINVEGVAVPAVPTLQSSSV